MRVWSAIVVLLAGASGAIAQSAQDSITGEGRFNWALYNTVGPVSLFGGVVSSGWGTLFDAPKEYDTHWDGFGKRYGMRLTGIATGNAMEAGLGALWDEDPRYHRAEGQPFPARVRNVVKFTFLTRNQYGDTVPAYARYAGIAGGNFLSNTWRPNSEATTGQAVERIGLGFLGRMSSNAILEFWPDIRQRVFHGGR
jgi:hypothetical protein